MKSAQGEALIDFLKDMGLVIEREKMHSPVYPVEVDQYWTTVWCPQTGWRQLTTSE